MPKNAVHLSPSTAPVVALKFVHTVSCGGEDTRSEMDSLATPMQLKYALSRLGSNGELESIWNFGDLEAVLNEIDSPEVGTSVVVTEAHEQSPLSPAVQYRNSTDRPDVSSHYQVCLGMCVDESDDDLPPLEPCYSDKDGVDNVVSVLE